MTILNPQPVKPDSMSAATPEGHAMTLPIDRVMSPNVAHAG